MVTREEEMQGILDQVLSKITPGDEERVAMERIASRLLERINGFSDEHGVCGMLVGSAARDTWVSGEHDIDLFILFPESTERERLEIVGLLIAGSVLSDAERIEERYAEHPYLHGVVNGYGVDVVPCFNIRDPSKIKSAVDRTPHHNSFVREEISGLEGDVRLTKQFLKRAGIYGSELKIHGFSGYLAELLIIHFRSFMNLVRDAVDWKPGEVIDIKGHGARAHENPLVVVDPTDPGRNVAAALSLDNMCRFIDSARNFLEDPKIEFFFKAHQTPLELGEIRELLHKRGSVLIGVQFQKPDVVDDILYPQLEKMERSTKKLFKMHDFRIINTGSIVSKKNIYIIFELFDRELPSVKKHIGPPVWARADAERFKAKYHEKKTLSQIYIKNGRYVIEIERRYRTPGPLLREELSKCGLGKDLRDAIREQKFQILSKEELLTKSDHEVRIFIHQLLTHNDP
ncbi:CCA tRNA nucleotidyltransferase [Methanosarcinales archaeon]|nr:MAG: CCA tRNA nucleotidyltransferase [Methanosarcinales archaeon]